MRRLVSPFHKPESNRAGDSITCPECKMNISGLNAAHGQACKLAITLKGALGRSTEDNWKPLISTSNGRYEVTYSEAQRLCPNVVALAPRDLVTSRQLAAETVDAAQEAGAVAAGMQESFVLERAAEASLLGETLALVAPHLDTIMSPVPWDDGVKGCRLLGPQFPAEHADNKPVHALYVYRSNENTAALAAVEYVHAGTGEWKGQWKTISAGDACFAWRMPAILAALHDAFDRVAQGSADRRAAEARERAEMLGAVTTLVRGMRTQPPAGAGKKGR